MTSREDVRKIEEQIGHPEDDIGQCNGHDVIYGSEEEDTFDIVCFYDGLKWVALAKEEDIRK